MSILDRFKGVRRPKEGSRRVPGEELRRRLLALNHEANPFSVKVGEEADLEAAWRIVDSTWFEVFAKAGLEKVHRILIRVNEDRHEVMTLDEEWEVSWRAGVPSLEMSAEAFRGRTLGSKQIGRGYAFRGVNPLDFGQVYEYRFDVSEMKEPIAEVVTEAGWTLIPVLSKRKLRR